MPGNDGDDIWKAYAKGVKPLRPEHGPSPSHRFAVGPSLSRCAGEGKKRRAKAVQFRHADFHAPLDRNLEKRLRQGDMPIEARLDLHGMHQEEAHKALDRFIAAQIKAARRFLLIITGKGRGGEGVLRAALPGWLAASPHAARILALRTAAIRHGGGGAFYVLLKRSWDRDR